MRECANVRGRCVRQSQPADATCPLTTKKKTTTTATTGSQKKKRRRSFVQFFVYFLFVCARAPGRKKKITAAAAAPFTAMSSSSAPATNVCVIIKPHAILSLTDIVNKLKSTGHASIIQSSSGTLMKAFVNEFYAEHAGKPFMPRLLRSMTTGPVVVLQVRTDDVEALRAWAGPTDPEEARRTAPESMRAIYGTALPNNAVHVSDSADAGNSELATCAKWGMWNW
jgi:nucleoside diphosphate kinase